MIITESDLRQQLRQPRRNARVTVPPGATFTPAAADFIRTWQLDVHEDVVAPRPDKRGARAAWDRPGAFPVVLDGAVPTCVTCGMAVTAKPGHLTQLDAAHFALKTDPRIRLRGRLDTLQGLCLLAGSRALAGGERELAGHLDTLAAYCRELMSAEYHARLPEPLELAGIDEDALRAASHDPSAAVGIDHVVAALEHPELLHWLNVLRCEVREAETAALDALPPEHHPGVGGRSDRARAEPAVERRLLPRGVVRRPAGEGEAVNPGITRVLADADAAVERTSATPTNGRVRLGVDLGTAYIVLFAVDDDGRPLAGAYRHAQVVRDGVVVDFAGAAAVVRGLKCDLEARLGRPLAAAATCYPPGVALPEVRATGYVLEAAGLECTAMIEEPIAANAVLGVRNGAVVDVGGGTTGIAVFEDGEVVYSADEPTGGTHASLVVAGAYHVPFDEGEARKTDPAWQAELFPVVRPVLEKIGTIVAQHVRGRTVETVYLVGGTGIPALVPGNPLFVTPLGVALHDGRDEPAMGRRA